MGFTAATGTLMDATRTTFVCAVANVQVTDGIGRSPAAFVCQPSIDFAMADNHGFVGYVLLAGGYRLRIQLQNWGMRGAVPYADGVVVG
jgi:hypothetical protein